MSQGRRIGISVDGSDQSLNAFNWFLDNLYRAGDTAIIIIITEYNLNVGVVPNHDAISKAVAEQEAKISNITGKLTDILKQRGVPGKVVRGGGKAGEAILELATKESVTSLVMGTRGLGSFKRTVLGSVSDFLIHNANFPVTIVPLN